MQNPPPRQVPAKELKNRELWSAGWKQREELEWSGDPNSPEGAFALPMATTPCVVCDGAGVVPCARKGCTLGLERVVKQKEVVAKTEKQFKRILQSTRERAEEDDVVRDMRRRVKRQLKDMSKADADGGGGSQGRRSTRKAGKKTSNKTNGGGGGGGGNEDWGAYGRARRDEKLERWMRGGDVNDHPEDNQ